MKALSAPRFFIIGEAILALAGSMGWIVLPIYYVLTAHMNPFELLLVAAVFEVTILICDVPTGLLADRVGRRPCVITGASLGGMALLIIGGVPHLSIILAASVLDGLGAALVNGAWQAWLRDETDDERFAPALARGTQVRQLGSVAGMGGGALLATLQLPVPMLAAGSIMILFSLAAVAVMPESYRRVPPVAAKEKKLRESLRAGVRLIGATRMLPLILVVAAILGAFTESIDQLGEPHFLLDVGLPPLFALRPVVWFGVIGAGGLILSAAALEPVRRRLGGPGTASAAAPLFVLTAGIVVAAVGFALAPAFVPALAAYWLWGMLRPLVDLFSTVWLNRQVTDGRRRATILSLGSAANAGGECVGGPLIGVAATVFSIPWALALSALLLAPALGLYGWALRSEHAAQTEGEPLASGPTVLDG